MKNPIISSIQKENKAIQFFGLPGTYKTTLLLQIIQKILIEKKKRIILIDTGGNFPIVRLKKVKDYLNNLIVFHPKTLKENALILDDLDIQLLTKDSVLFIDDVFRHTDFDDKKNYHLNSYLLALIKKISQRLSFPVIITNQARSFNEEIRPFLQNLTLQYLNLHLLFEKTREKNKIQISLFEQTQLLSQYVYNIDSKGFLEDWDK